MEKADERLVQEFDSMLKRSTFPPTLKQDLHGILDKITLEGLNELSDAYKNNSVATTCLLNYSRLKDIYFR